MYSIDRLLNIYNVYRGEKSFDTTEYEMIEKINILES